MWAAGQQAEAATPGIMPAGGLTFLPPLLVTLNVFEPITQHLKHVHGQHPASGSVIVCSTLPSARGSGRRSGPEGGFRCEVGLATRGEAAGHTRARAQRTRRVDVKRRLLHVAPLADAAKALIVHLVVEIHSHAKAGTALVRAGLEAAAARVPRRHQHLLGGGVLEPQRRRAAVAGAALLARDGLVHFDQRLRFLARL